MSEADLFKHWAGGLVAKDSGSKGHSFHDGSGCEGHSVGHITNRPNVFHCCPGVGVHLDCSVFV